MHDPRHPIVHAGLDALQERTETETEGPQGVLGAKQELTRGPREAELKGRAQNDTPSCRNPRYQKSMIGTNFLPILSIS